MPDIIYSFIIRELSGIINIYFLLFVGFIILFIFSL